MKNTIITKNSGKTKIEIPLKPCPICGEEDVLIVKNKNFGENPNVPMYAIYCPHCEMRFAMADWSAGKRTLVLTWNKRS